MKKIAAIIVAGLSLVFLFAFAALAHEWERAPGETADARWIKKNFPWCCGPKDCEPVQGRVSLENGRWRVRGLKGSLPGDQVKPSPDGRPWACRNIHTNELRCIFLPKCLIKPCV